MISLSARAQIDPSKTWRTLHTAHFLVHFTPPLESVARRLAVDAERAYTNLSTELAPPRGVIDVVLSDEVDFTNGSATPFPTNRIVLYANPPVTESALRFTDEWYQMGIQHELTHIFHLDRVRGIWALGQDVFGRSPVLFPNMYAPSWLTEGLAVYYESRFSHAGRVRGSEHRMIARAAAVGGAFPSLDRVSLASPRFPFGEVTYAYGSLFMDWLARTRGDTTIRKFVDDESAQLIPVWLDRPAKEAFGVSFSSAWKQWGDSIRGSVAPLNRSPMAGWKPLSTDAIFVNAPRWDSDTSIVYSGDPGRETYGAYRADVTGRHRRIGRRNSASPNVALHDGSLLFSQLDFTGPYTERSDLWIEHRGHEYRLTTGERLADPDVRADGAIVAMQIIAGGTRIVRVSPDGKAITPITDGDMDNQWAEPRWSHRGDRIAAVYWTRGGVSRIVVLDTVGRGVAILAAGHSIQATPSWSADDRGVYYTSDKTGSTEVYYHPVHGDAEYLVSSAATGLFDPQLSPNGNRLAAVVFRSDGFQLGLADCCTLTRPDTTSYPAALPVSEVAADSSPATSYAMWHSLWPRYWVPTLESGVSSNSVRIGALTSGEDAVGRHSYSAQVAVPTDNSGIVGTASYSYRGLGLPIVNLFASQEWEHYFFVGSRTNPQQILGEVRRRTRDAELSFTWSRPRVRTFLTGSLGGGLERKDYVGLPGGTIQLVDTIGRYNPATFPFAFGSAAWSNVQFPPYAISPEDGVTLGLSSTEKLVSSFTGTGLPSNTVIAAASAFKSFDVGGFAHHVLALHGAAGATDLRANGYLEVGGVSGGSFDLLPGVTLGQGRRTFGVRGFPPVSLFGTQAAAGSVEWRAPLWLAGRGLGMLPLFFDRASLSVFGDAGSARCPNIATYSNARQVCTSIDQHFAVQDMTAKNLLASVGGELNLSASVLSWDTPYRFRLGYAVPVAGKKVSGAAPYSIYVAVGSAF